MAKKKSSGFLGKILLVGFFVLVIMFSFAYIFLTYITPGSRASTASQIATKNNNYTKYCKRENGKSCTTLESRKYKSGPYAGYYQIPSNNICQRCWALVYTGKINSGNGPGNNAGGTACPDGKYQPYPGSGCIDY